MLDHLRELSEVEFLPEIDAAGAKPFTPARKLKANAMFDAKVATSDLLSELGVVDDEEVLAPIVEKQSSEAFVALVGDDEKAKLAAVGALTLPESVRGAVSMLTQYQWDFVQQAKELRSYVVSKIVAETEHPDAKVRLKALQMLGNVTEVALFTERHEVKTVDKTDDEVEKLIREKLAKFATKVLDVSDAKVVSTTPEEPQA